MKTDLRPILFVIGTILVALFIRFFPTAAWIILAAVTACALAITFVLLVFMALETFNEELDKRRK